MQIKHMTTAALVAAVMVSGAAGTAFAKEGGLLGGLKGDVRAGVNADLHGGAGIGRGDSRNNIDVHNAAAVRAESTRDAQEGTVEVKEHHDFNTVPFRHGERDGNKDGHRGIGSSVRAFVTAQLFGHHHDKSGDGQGQERARDDGRIMGAARVTAVTANTITAAGFFGRADTTVTLNISADTDFSLRAGRDASLDDVRVGDVIIFRGTVENRTEAALTVDAAGIRNWGNVDIAAKARVAGTVASVNDTDGTFVVTLDDGRNVTVATNASTSVRTGTSAGAFADVEAGATVRVRGFWNSLRSAVTAVVVRIF